MFANKDLCDYKVHPYRAFFFIDQVKLLTWQPGLHFSCLTVVLLRLQSGVQQHRPPLCLQLQNLPQLAHMPRPFTHKLHLRGPQWSDNPRPVQNLLNTSPPSCQLPLECLKERSEISGKRWSTFRPHFNWSWPNVIFDTYLVLFNMLLYTLEVIPIILTGGHGKPLLNPQLSRNNSQVITYSVYVRIYVQY